MAAWRKKAIAEFPEISNELRNTNLNSSIYEVLGYVFLELWQQAATSGNHELGGRIASFVEWASQHKDPDIANAAGVSFLEHLPDDPIRLSFAEEILSEHLYRTVINLSAHLHRSNEPHSLKLSKSLLRYNMNHKTKIVIKGL